MNYEMTNFMRVYIIVVASLTYCYFVSSRIPKGNARLISLLPVISIFTYIPLLFSSVLLQFYSGAFIGWLASFKLLLFAFGRDDTLSISPSISLLHFIVITIFPIKIKQNQQQTRSSKSSEKSKIRISISSLNPVLWYAFIRLYQDYKQHMPVTNLTIIHFLYTARLFFGIQLHFAFVGTVAKLLLKQEIEPQFDEPLLPTSLQNFWGKRWNLMFSSVLKSTVQEPIRTFFTPLLGRRWVLHLALVVTFIISGLMHELVYFYVGRRRPTWEVTWYFLIHGVCLAIEVEMKKIASQRGWKLHPLLSTLLAAGFVSVTSIWLIFAQLIHCGADAKEIDEYIAFANYVKLMLY